MLFIANVFGEFLMIIGFCLIACSSDYLRDRIGEI